MHSIGRAGRARTARALVTEVARALQRSRRVRVARAFDRVRPPPVHGEPSRAAGQDAAALAASCSAKRPSERLRDRCPPEQRLGQEREPSASAASASSPSSTASSAASSACSTASSSRSRSRKRQVATPSCATASVSRSSSGFLDRLEEERGRLVLRLVRAHACEPPSALRSCDAPDGSGDHLAELRLGPTRVAGLEVQVGGLDGAAQGVLGAIRGRQLARAVEEERRRPRRASARACCCAASSSARDGLVRAVDRRGQLPRARLGILEQLGEPRAWISIRRAGSASRTHRRRAAGA